MAALNPLAQSLSPADAAGNAPSPLPSGGPAGDSLPPMGLDPAQLGGAPQDPMAMGMSPAGGNPYPTTDPEFMSQVFAQLMQMKQSDQQTFSDNQDQAMFGNPLAQSMMAGAPMGPGAGQDGQGISMDPTAMPPQPPMQGA
jgi:hypothetical protein